MAQRCSEGAVNNFELTICGLHEIILHRNAKITHFISILDPDQPDPVGAEICDPACQLHLRFHDVPDAGLGFAEPTAAHVAQMLEFARALPRDQPVHLLIHCFAGISRSTATAFLVWAQREPERDLGDIWAEIVFRRPQTWPNLRIIEMGDHMLGRRGQMIDVVRRHYRAVAAVNPYFVRELRTVGYRDREIDL
jgi:predicted protein tyrosine phosphatase